VAWLEGDEKKVRDAVQARWRRTKSGNTGYNNTDTVNADDVEEELRLASRK
jgi:hypothetical protein